MANGPITVAGRLNLNQNIGTLPQMQSELADWFQPIVATRIIKIQNQYETIERGVPINFVGVIQPLDPRKLMIKPEGQREWKPFRIHCYPTVKFENDDVIVVGAMRLRIMAELDYSAYGYMEYHALQDYQDSWIDPPPVPQPQTGSFSAVIDMSDPSFPSATVVVVQDNWDGSGLGGITDAFSAEWRLFTLNDDGSLTQYEEAGSVQVIDELTVQVTVSPPAVYQLNGVQ